MNRLPEPRDNDWTRITFEYEVDNVKLLPPNLEVDCFVDGDEIDFDTWTLTFHGELLNGGEPDVTAIYATRYNGETHHNEPAKGALLALLEAYIYRPDRRELMKAFAIDKGMKHYRRSAA